MSTDLPLATPDAPPVLKAIINQRPLAARVMGIGIVPDAIRPGTVLALRHRAPSDTWQPPNGCVMTDAGAYATGDTLTDEQLAKL